jgi:crotonobetainyl-CoA:carnitine CoA-transferase CaiB-like acyl-CoA transferase
MKKALEDIKVLDLTHLEAGTSGTILLALLGAEVIKVERPEGGDEGRWLLTEKPGLDSYYFMNLNANKKSITLNLANEKGKGIFKELVKKMDVVTENFTYGTMDRMGLGFKTLREINPRLICASLNGYGNYGPYHEYPGYDYTTQAMAGAMSFTGFPDGPPLRFGPTIGDCGPGSMWMIGILAAIIQRETTGKGQDVEVSMQDTLVHYLRSLYFYHHITGKPLQRTGNRGAALAPWNTYETKDGHIVICAPLNHQWENLVRLLGREDLLEDERLKMPMDRGKYADETDPLIEEWTKKRTKKEAMDQLIKADVPCGMVLDTGELLEDPHLRAREMFVEIDYPKRGKFPVIGSPIKLSDSPVKMEPSPLLGQHNEEIYSKLLGYNKEDIARLKEEKII